MGLVNWFKDRWEREAKRYKYVNIDSKQVQLSGGRTADSEPLVAGNHYFRLWLVGMSLKNDREWFKSWQPAVYSSITFKFGDKTETLTHVAGQSRLKDVSSQSLDKVIALNYPLTALVPFNGGTIELDAGLVAIQGKDDVAGFIKVLGDFSKLLVVPQLSAALAIAEPLANGVSELVGATSGNLQLGLHQVWQGKEGAGDNVLRASYFAVFLAEDKELESNKFWVREDRLGYGNELFSGYHYMLFRIERLDERDDWDSLTAIQEPYDQAIEMLKTGHTDQADAYIRAAKAAAFKSKELTKNVDRRRVVTQIQKQYDVMKEDLGAGAFAEADTSLKSVMRGAMTPGEAAASGEMQFDEIL